MFGHRPGTKTSGPSAGRPAPSRRGGTASPRQRPAAEPEVECDGQAAPVESFPPATGYRRHRPCQPARSWPKRGRKRTWAEDMRAISRYKMPVRPVMTHFLPCVSENLLMGVVNRMRERPYAAKRAPIQNPAACEPCTNTGRIRMTTPSPKHAKKNQGEKNAEPPFWNWLSNLCAI